MPIVSAQSLLETLNGLPHASLGFYPTPLHRLDRLSRELGISLYLKREDLSGVSVFGGNKIRKLQYLLGECLRQGCDSVVTFGATQSNHAMQTAAACRRCGLNPILFLTRIVEPDAQSLRANLLLDHLYDAQVHLVPLDIDREAFAKSCIAQWEQEGRRCYVIPAGGSNEVGATGFAECYAELATQLEAEDIPAEYLVHCTGSGGTLAGLAAGKKLLGGRLRILSVASGPKDEEYEEQVAQLSTRAIGQLGFDAQVFPEELSVDRGYYLPGYEQANGAATQAIRLLARTEGLLLDPVYTGKAFSALLDYVRTGKIPQKSTVVFLHTGGATALFSEPQIVGKLAYPP